MVFNIGFDNTIWMILSSDKKYRKEIAEFIYNLPKDIYDSICKYLREYNYDGKSSDYEIGNFKKFIRDDNGINNYYCINISPYKIEINLKKWNSAGDRPEDNINLILYAVTLDELISLDNYLCIGSYNYKSSRFLNSFTSILSVNGDEREYEIYDVDDMKLMLSILDVGFDNKINLNRMPQELELSDLRDRRSVSRLVRGRKKK